MNDSLSDIGGLTGVTGLKDGVVQPYKQIVVRKDKQIILFVLEYISNLLKDFSACGHNKCSASISYVFFLSNNKFILLKISIGFFVSSQKTLLF